MHTKPHRPHDDSLVVIDAEHGRSGMAAIHMLVDAGRVAFVDTGCNDSLPQVLAALKARGLTRDAVDYVILTHVHLDHAGGAGAMMQAFPQAKLVVHPRGARHMADPSQLIAGVTAVYGREYVQKMYGEILPVTAARIVQAQDGLRLTLGGRVLEMLDSPGHARHHICIVDHGGKRVFTGDTAGIAYPEFDVDGRVFLFPTTTPTQFDPDDMLASLDRIAGFSPAALCLTHFGPVAVTPGLLDGLRQRVRDYAVIARKHAAASDAEAAIREELWQTLREALHTHGVTLEPEAVTALLDMDVRLNAQGLVCWLEACGLRAP